MDLWDVTTQGNASHICTLISKGLIKIVFEAPRNHYKSQFYPIRNQNMGLGLYTIPFSLLFLSHSMWDSGCYMRRADHINFDIWDDWTLSAVLSSFSCMDVLVIILYYSLYEHRSKDGHARTITCFVILHDKSMKTTANLYMFGIKTKKITATGWLVYTQSSKFKGKVAYTSYIFDTMPEKVMDSSTYLLASDTDNPQRAPAALSWRPGEAFEQDCARAT